MYGRVRRLQRLHQLLHVDGLAEEQIPEHAKADAAERKEGQPSSGSSTAAKGRQESAFSQSVTVSQSAQGAARERA